MQLSEDEKVVWRGRPVPMSFTSLAIPTFFLGMAIVLFCFVWLWLLSIWVPRSTHVIRDEQGLNLMRFFIMPFLVIGVHLLLTPIRFYWHSRNTEYFLTTKRALVLVEFTIRKVRTLLPEERSRLSLRQRSSAIGDIAFNSEPTIQKLPMPLPTDGIYAIRNASEAFRLVRKLHLSNRTRMLTKIGINEP